MAKLQDATRDLIAGGGRYTAPFLCWQRGINPGTVVERLESGKPVDVHLGDSQFRLENLDDLSEMHVLTRSGKFEQLKDPQLGEVLFSGKMADLKSEKGSYPYVLYNLLSGQWPGEVKHFSQKVDRLDVLGKAFLQHGLLQPEDFPQPARAESLRAILEKDLASKSAAEDSLKQNGPLWFSGRLGANTPDHMTAQSVQLEDRELSDPKRVKQVLQALDAVRVCESESFGVHLEDTRAHHALVKSVWKSDFDLEATLASIRRCAKFPQRQTHLYELLKRPADEQRSEVYFRGLEVLKTKIVPENVQLWLAQNNTEQRLDLLRAARDLYPDGTPSGPIFRTALALETHRDQAAAERFAVKVAKLEEPQLNQNFPSHLKTPVQHRERFLELYAESGSQLPLDKCFKKIDELGEDWKLRYEPMRESGMSASWATWAGVHLPDHKKENLELARALVPSYPGHQTYQEALEFATTLSPESKAAFGELYGGDNLQNWESGREYLFKDGKDPDPATLEVARILHKNPPAGYYRLEYLIEKKAPMDVVKANLTASPAEQQARSNRWHKHFEKELARVQAEPATERNRVAAGIYVNKLAKLGRGEFPWGEPPV